MLSKAPRENMPSALAVLRDWHVPALLLLYVFLIPLGESSLAVILFFAIGGSLLLYRDGKELFKEYRDWIYLSLALSIPIAISLLTAVRFEKTLISFIVFFAHGLAGIYVFVWCARNWTPNFLLYGIVTILSFWMVTALPNLLSGNLVMVWQEWLGALTGYIGSNRNPGALLSHFSPIYFEALYRASLRLRNRVPWLLAIPYLLVILLAGNRTSWMIVSLVIVIFLVRLLVLRHFSIRAAIASFFVVGLTLFLTMQYFPHFEQRLMRSLQAFQGNIESINYAGSSRVEIWQGGMSLAKDSLLTGKGTYAFGLLNYQRGYVRNNWGHAHLYWLEVLVATGLLGLLLYLAVFTYLVNRLFWHIPWSSSAFSVMLTAVAMILPFNPNWDFYSSRVASLICFTLILGFAFMYGTQSSRSQHNTKPSCHKPSDQESLQ